MYYWKVLRAMIIWLWFLPSPSYFSGAELFLRAENFLDQNIWCGILDKNVW